MNEQNFLKYLYHTPNNTNRNMMESLLQNINKPSQKAELFDFIEEQLPNINPNILDLYLAKVFEDFGDGVTYTVRIDTNNPDSLACCTYLDDAAGMQKGSSEWDNKPIFNEIKPCVFKDGKVVYYLNPQDYTKKIDGTASVLTGEDGDVMVEFSKFAYRIYNEGDYTYVSISNDANTIAKDLHFKYLPFTRLTDGDCNKIYISAYQGSIIDGKLRSISGVIPTVDTTIGEFRAAAQSNGVGYEQLTFYQMTMLQCLYLIRYGNLNSQAALGQGYTMTEEPASTGGANALAMYSGNVEDGTVQVKFAGIEDFYGNVLDFIDGAYCDDTYHLMVATNNFNDLAEGYQDVGAICTQDTAGLLKSIWGDTTSGFVLKEVLGEGDFDSEEELLAALNTWYCDGAGARAGCFGYFGASFDDGPGGGAFTVGLDFSASLSSSIIGARLSYY